jgi:hypothetical protein
MTVSQPCDHEIPWGYPSSHPTDALAAPDLASGLHEAIDQAAGYREVAHAALDALARLTRQHAALQRRLREAVDEIRQRRAADRRAA